MPDRRSPRTKPFPPFLSGLLGLLTLTLLMLSWPAVPVSGSDHGDFLLFLSLVATVMVSAEALMNGGELWRLAGLRVPRDGTAYRLPVEKLAGTIAAAVASLAALWLFDFYRTAPFDAFRDLVLYWWPLIALFLLAYVCLVDRLMTDPRDSLWHFGAWLLSRGRTGDLSKGRHFLLGVGIKLFFLPLMFGYGLQDWIAFRTEALAPATFLQVYDLAYRFMFFADVCLGGLGYLFASRLINTHIRHCEDSVSGWVICLLCYAPFWQVFMRGFFDYGDDYTWVTLTGPSGPLAILWGLAILGSIFVYLMSTAAFGLNFSNLSCRTIIRHGPYAWTSHPAYAAKCLSMWLIQIPFLGTGTFHEILGNVVALLGICGIYALRAAHEERCLMRDPDYRCYRRWLRQYGLWARLRRVTWMPAAQAVGRSA